MEISDLKQLVAEVSLKNRALKKKRLPASSFYRWYERYQADRFTTRLGLTD